ncbi:MAG: DUF4358 domain-containing protein [Eubacteriales bacterium]
MKKLIVLLLCALTLLSSAACGSGGGAADTSAPEAKTSEVADAAVSDIVDACVAAYSADTLPTIQYYRSGAGEDAEDYLDPGYAGVIFYDEYGADVTLLSSLDSYAMATPVGKRIFEIDIMKTKDAADNEAVLALYKERLDRKLQSDIVDYAPEEYPFLKSAEYYAVGNYVIFVSTTDNTVAKGVISDMLTPSAGE